ncbi:hypothetical protein B0T17DRAFT_37872 [Bombardia bombarda]|uniref:2EXR domain-containing protein n=1 Tax=Bombardia bombarda TaxID=252184 RepID=A0AA39XLM8_9PEZI|nr:hypothetical protein B0T17DRAFT_37872 [Bombardia bombarda]
MTMERCPIFAFHYYLNGTPLVFTVDATNRSSKCQDQDDLLSFLPAPNANHQYSTRVLIPIFLAFHVATLLWLNWQIRNDVVIEGSEGYEKSSLIVWPTKWSLFNFKAAVRQKQLRSPKKFHKFGQLPPEIRQMIWQEALPTSRLLMLQLPKPTVFTDRFLEMVRRRRCSEDRHLQNNVWTCSAKAPAISHVNSEARYIALKHYRLGLAPGNTQPQIYVNFERDIIGLSDDVMRSSVGRNLWRLTADVKEVWLLGVSFKPSASRFLSSREWNRLKELRLLAVVDSAFWGTGVLPRLARVDWPYWIAQQKTRGYERFTETQTLKQYPGGLPGLYVVTGHNG